MKIEFNEWGNVELEVGDLPLGSVFYSLLSLGDAIEFKEVYLVFNREVNEEYELDVLNLFTGEIESFCMVSQVKTFHLFLYNKHRFS